MKPKYKFWKQNKNFRRKTKILEGNQKLWKETKKFTRKPKILEGKQNKIWKGTKKIGNEILTPLGHRKYACSKYSRNS